MKVRQSLCVVVDGYSTGNALAPVFAGYGYGTAHVQSSPDVPAVLTRTFRPDDYVECHVHEGDLDGLCAALLRGDRRVLCVVAAAESGVMLADRLCERLGVPGNGTALSPARRDKALMARTVAGASLATIPHLLSGQLEEIRRWTADRGDSVVVMKPVSSSGTYGFHICEGQVAIERAYRELLGSRDVFGTEVRQVLVQPYVRGEEFCVNTVGYDGDHVVTDVWRTRKTRRGVSNVYDLETLLPPDDPAFAVLTGYTRQVLSALGIEYGPAHTEVMLTDDGPILVESGARFMGSLDTSLVTQATGSNAVLVTAEAYLTPDRFRVRYREPSSALRSQPALVQMVSAVRGTLRRYRIDLLAVLPSFHGVDTYLAPGDPVVPTVDSYSSPGLIFLSADSQARIDEDYRRIRELERAGSLYETADGHPS